MAAVLAFAVDAWDFSLNPERRPVAAALHATDRLVERAVAVVVLAALDVAFVELGRERIKIVCYPHDGKGGPKVASAYIELA